ncbi:hypothetical protein K4L06_13300 [Lysobacter sp. BMK333-48F3]|uniref:hypothetical protein n=1 Tax=Lysobacter sp. BMK333-48F3 TaxID=2867962 RepID=UPI001C8C8A8A|nr:hypothetical protein [Lysobacter sp. BMK333-48F3]MBX9402285.1 hypothetical protein [Lysobacter sp. BMK333-48F3]
MHTYVLLFRRNRQQPLAPTDELRLKQSVAFWVEQKIDAGHRLVPHSLSPEGHHVGPHSDLVRSDDLMVSGLLFFVADSYEQAVRVADSHPATDFGFSVEMRAWSTPNRAAVAAANAA